MVITLGSIYGQSELNLWSSTVYGFTFGAILGYSSLLEFLIKEPMIICQMAGRPLLKFELVTSRSKSATHSVTPLTYSL